MSPKRKTEEQSTIILDNATWSTNCNEIYANDKLQSPRSGVLLWFGYVLTSALKRPTASWVLT